ARRAPRGESLRVEESLDYRGSAPRRPAPAEGREPRRWRAGPERTKARVARMTESDWLAEGDPGVLLGWARGRASERKLRLFACACCRALGEHLTGEAGRRAVEVAEAFADGKVAAWELERARRRSTSPVSAAAALPDAGRAAEERS